MTVALAMVLVGSMLIYGGWLNLSVLALLRGDNTQPKPAPRAPQVTG